ncbi:MAG: TonB-dependent receptor, partial [Bacteroidota bacterium]
MRQRLLYFFACILSGVSVCAQADTLPWSIDLDDVVVTAQYAPTEARNAIHKVTVLNRQEWEEQGLNDLSELLQRQMTMQVNPDPILGNGLSIQGIGGQNVQIMIDGVPVVGRLGGEIDLTQLNLTQFARVEIIAGAMSARYGSDAAGGVINLITAKEQANLWKIEAGGQYETIDLDRQHLRLGRQLGDWQIDGGLNRYVARFAPEDSLRAGSVPWNPKDQFGYDLNLRYRPSDSLRLNYGYRRFDETVSLLGDIRRPRFRPYVVDEIFDTRRKDHSLGASIGLSPSLSAELTAGWNTFDRYKRTRRRDLEPDTTRLLPGGQDTTRYTGQLVRFSVNTTHQRALGGQLGLEYRWEGGSGGRILDTATQSRTPTTRNVAAWAGLRYRLTATWTVEATARIGYNSRYDHPVVPALHLLWRPTEQWRWRASYAAGFRAPAIQELFFNFIDVNHYIIGSQSLAAERSRNWRLQGAWDGGRRLPLSVDGELFYNRIQDRITIADLAGDARFTYVNLNEYETHGATLQLHYAPDDQWSITTGGALTRVS